MKFVLIFGPPAVGKMTVGKELARRTGLKLFHNHMSIRLVRHFFDFGEEGFRRLDRLFRFGIFREVAGSELPGLIFTFVWALNEEADHAYVEEILEIFREKNAEIYLVELEADLGERLVRNRQPDRIAEKPSKQDIAHSEKVLLYHEENYRFNSHEGEISYPNFLKINNSSLAPEMVVDKILENFPL